MSTLRNALIGLTLLAAAIGSWLLGRTGAGVDPASGPPPPAQLGYYLRDAVLLGGDEEGRMIYRVHAQMIEQTPERRALALRSVRVEYRDAENVEWQVSAARAEAPNDGAYLDLEGDVRLVARPQSGTQATVIETQRLHLDPRAYLATSDAAVRIADAQVVLSARGLEADLKRDRLELHSEVRGQFFP